MDGCLLAAETASASADYGFTATMIVVAFIMVALNGFFVAAEFALVKVRPSQIDHMVVGGLPFAKSAKWLVDRMDHSLSACQLGITMASLALGYVGEPAFAKLVGPAMESIGISNESAIHIISFIIAFSFITSLHLVIGEQAPKIFAIRNPESVVRWCAVPMKFFFYLLFPFMYALNWATEVILGWFGLGGGSGHDLPHSEDEIRALLAESHIHGHLTRSEHTLLNAVFEFDDMVCRLVMVPRGDVIVLDINKPFPELLQQAKVTKHTRYPVCDGSLDDLLGVVHIKDLLWVDSTEVDFDIRSIMRDPVKVPENMTISKVLRVIQNTHQLMTFVVDEYGTIIGIATLENVLEKIVGPVDDEFDNEEDPPIMPESKGTFLVQGQTPISEVERALDVNLDDDDADTVAGVLMSKSGKLPEAGDRVKFEGAVAEVVEVKNDHAEKIRFTLVEVDESD
jgi:CBS domain containing-hemolysin-like protein